MNAKSMIQIRCSVNQADHTVVPRKDTWLSVDHFLERFVFHTDPLIIAQLLTGVLSVRKMGRKELWVSKHLKNASDNCENLLGMWLWVFLSQVGFQVTDFTLRKHILVCED